MTARPDARQLSAVERLEAALGRIQSTDGEGSRAFTAVFADGARREAEASDQRTAAGLTRGPLDGRIVSVKALFDVSVTVTSAGSAVLRGLPAATSDAVVLKHCVRQALSSLARLK